MVTLKPRYSEPMADLKALIKQGEGVSVEFKECRRTLTRNVYETVCAFPVPKNPVIAAFFREIHRADELGSGMRNMMKYGKAYGGEDPEMIEGDVFRTIVKYPDSAVYEEDSATTAGPTPQVTPQVTPEVTPK